MEGDQTTRPPFSAREIRDALVPGQYFTYLIDTPGTEAYRRRTTIVDADEEKAIFEYDVLDVEGIPVGEPTRESLRWRELERRAIWPANHTEISETTMRVPAGEFVCRLYTVNEEEGGSSAITRTYLARELPGMPVMHMITIDGMLVSQMTLVDYSGRKQRRAAH